MRNLQNERLKLLATFKAIYDDASLVKVAQKQGVTQSAISKQLQKLRDWFEDDLFVKTPSGMMPTARAQSLLLRIEHILEELEILNESPEFDASKLDGKFVIETTDEVSRLLAPRLLKAVNLQAPRLDIAIRPLEQEGMIRSLELGEVDLVISVNWHAPGELWQKRLYGDHFVVLMGKEHPLAGAELTIQGFSDALHLLVAPMGRRRGYIDEFLAQRGYERKVKLSVASFSEITSELLSDRFIVTLPNQVATRVHDQDDLVIRSLPFDVPMFNYYMLWHRRFNNQQRNKWMRGEIEKLLAPSVIESTWMGAPLSKKP